MRIVFTLIVQNSVSNKNIKVTSTIICSSKFLLKKLTFDPYKSRQISQCNLLNVIDNDVS